MYPSSITTETAFYAAFSAADLDAMMAVWATAGDIICIHPSGPRLEGLDEIRQSWAAILTQGMPRNFALRGRQIIGADDLHVHTLEEHITVPGTAYVAPPVLATNIYQRFGDSWYMIAHHASVAPSALGSSTRAPSPASVRVH